MTTQDSTSATPPRPARYFRLFIVTGCLCLVFAALLLLSVLTLHTAMHRQQGRLNTLQQTVASLETTVGQNDTTLATLRVQQTEALGTLKKLDQQAFTHRPAIARLFTALSALDNA